ncbi:MAG TPA: hypothetical protein DCL73_04770 [Treponema sp.]|nr:hypothetical protein [Treponema sp.]
MKKRSPKFYNTILALGMLMIIAGFLMFVLFSETAENSTAVLWPVLLMVCGAVFLYFTMSFTNNSFQLFLGLLLTSSGILFSLCRSGIIPYRLQEWWPVSVVFAGFSLFASGYYKHRKILFAYTFPSLTLVVLGTLFLFFSFHVVHVSLRSFVALTGPFLLIAAGLFLVFLFLFQKRHSSFHIEDESDEIDDDAGIFSEQGDNR